MPRFSYWTILLGELPTSFRAKDRNDLVPTLKQLQRVHPEARLKWFENGRLWVSAEEARFERERTRAIARPRADRRPPDRATEPRRDDARSRSPRWSKESRRPQDHTPRTPRAPRAPERAEGERKGIGPRPEKPTGGWKSAWRPGGEHRDPNARVKVPRDVRRARYRQRNRNDKPRSES